MNKGTPRFRAARMILGVAIIVLTSLFRLNGTPHPVIFAEYSLEYQENQWVLSFTQKTSYLRDAIYAKRPDLKGTNMNSSEFLEATVDHIRSSLSLKSRGAALTISPQYLKYGGLRFESRFILNDLPEGSEYLSIKTGGYDVHEHSIIVFQVAEGNLGHMKYFNRNESEATFDFETKQFMTGDFTPAGGSKISYYFLILLALIVVFAMLIGVKRQRGTLFRGD